jgi:hypothetical protein
MTSDLNDLLIEVEAKRDEIGGGSTRAVLQELMRDAAQAYLRPTLHQGFAASFETYPFRGLLRDGSAFDFCERLLDSIERGHDTIGNVADLAADSRSRRVDLPTPTEARRLRVVTATVPALIPSSSRGVAGKPATAWVILWRSACGEKAPQIAESLKRSDGDSVKRNQVFRIINKTYDAIAAQIDDALFATRSVRDPVMKWRQSASQLAQVRQL